MVAVLSPLQESAQPPRDRGPPRCQPAGFAGCPPPQPCTAKSGHVLPPYWGSWGAWSLQLACLLLASSGAFPGASLSEEAAET